MGTNSFAHLVITFDFFNVLDMLGKSCIVYCIFMYGPFMDLCTALELMMHFKMGGGGVCLRLNMTRGPLSQKVLVKMDN